MEIFEIHENYIYDDKLYAKPYLDYKINININIKYKITVSKI